MNDGLGKKAGLGGLSEQHWIVTEVFKRGI